MSIREEQVNITKEWSLQHQRIKDVTEIALDAIGSSSMVTGGLRRGLTGEILYKFNGSTVLEIINSSGKIPASLIDGVVGGGITSVNGSNGPTVSLTTDDIPEGVTNKYFPNQQAYPANMYLFDFTTPNLFNQPVIVSGINYIPPNGVTNTTATPPPSGFTPESYTEPNANITIIPNTPSAGMETWIVQHTLGREPSRITAYKPDNSGNKVVVNQVTYLVAGFFTSKVGLVFGQSETGNNIEIVIS